MFIIAHRGLTHGPDPAQENDPDLIQSLLDASWHVEADVRFDQGEWYLGHDQNQYKVTAEYLCQPGLWLHVKDVTCASEIQCIWKIHPHLNFFWHESDARVLTSQGYWWTQPGHDLTYQSVAVMPETHVPDWCTWHTFPCVGICTDWGIHLI
jgi:hypothetical protein